jgi:competence protein ComEA
MSTSLPPPRRPGLPLWLEALRVERQAVFGLALVGALAVALAVFFALRAQPEEVERLAAPAGATAAVDSGAPTSSATAPSSPALLVVDVAGRVRRPGLVRVPPGSRVFDVVQAAGGFRKPSDSRTVNLARPVADGEQVLVGATGPDSAPGVVPSDPAAAIVSLNTATAVQLEELPGVGPVLAQRIVEHRMSLGGTFTSVDQLRDVSGIGDATFAEIEPHVRL